MRLFLDECLPHALVRALAAHHSVKTADDMGWNGVQNGRLLKALRESNEFDVFVTADKSLPHQQNLRDIPFAIVVLRLRSTRVADVLARVPALSNTCRSPAPARSRWCRPQTDCWVPMRSS